MKKYIITSISDENVSFEKISSANILEDVLNYHTNLNDYSTVNELFIVFVALDKNSIPRPDKVSYLKKSNTLQIVINLDFQQIVNTTNEEVIKIMAETYLQTIEKYLFNRKDFDGSKFYETVKQLFIEKCILKTEELVLV